MPKGVEMTHRAAMNTVLDVNRRFEVKADDRVLAVSALEFDLAVYDIFGLLSAGGAVVLIEDENKREARHWVELARRWGVTVWNSVPALLEMLLIAAESNGSDLDLRLALVSGDWVGLDLPGRLRMRCPGCHLIALGGATEAGIWSNAFEVAQVDDSWRSIPYGSPLRNQKFRVVDGRGRDCPDWVPGELWIGGRSLAEGYRDDPRQTAGRFVEQDGERWYRTGDSGRYWPGGTLEFLGRLDQQVKIRGHRIELGEVEAALESHPQVGRAVAVAAGKNGGQLAAAVVAREGFLDETALKVFAAGRLPPYMVPARIIAVAELPLGPTGKVDRRAVGELIAGAKIESDDEPPRGPVESALAKLWGELLGTPEVGRWQNFFALGGDSLMATRLLESIRKEFSVDIPLRSLMATPTVGELSHLIEEAAAEFEEGRI
jgi:acyl-coenzyme A synthetase/AMP-(fatty) acid ligase/acyl carrier protein